MDVSLTPAKLAEQLELMKARFYRSGGSVNNLRIGTRANHDYATFDYNANSETANGQTVIALKSGSPKMPTTNLSRSSGIQLERLGEWILAYEPGRTIGSDQIVGFIDDVLKLLEYARDFPQNT